ncbi:hypothetical protein F3Y22_tig00110328pilonHSYRG00758 [Hibiscus syriacus]|uniref:Peroxisomal multifunctional enzyme type 2-like N-terminal domain-containing protein n=1 Tax=Hibiscus syriacus TaxID=106335 RepID=A0A6A3AYW4_HIBSY|nr:hypothetical protein F3Y22_tig00110328pilonHSYRG00758 [Hibiscus syriacus]
MAHNSACNPELVLAHKFSEETFTYTERDVAVYALGVGACGRDAIDTDELNMFTMKTDSSLQGFANIFTFSLGVQPQYFYAWLRFDARLLLHGQQYIDISHFLQMPLTSVFLRGAGGFSDPSKPFTYLNYPVNQTSMKIPKTQPLRYLRIVPNHLRHACTVRCIFMMLASPEVLNFSSALQALLYRLSGDYNPCIQTLRLGRLQDSRGRFCMDCAPLGLPYGLSSNVFAGETQTL